MYRMLVLVFLPLAVLAQLPPVPGSPEQLAAIRFIDIRTGTGVPYAAGKRLAVHYTGWLRDGTKFDSSVDRNEPFEFVQGRRQVITGWDLGFEGMKAGGKRRLFIPYQFAYGEAGTGPIPAKAELIFDVELLNVSDAQTLIPAIDILLPLRLQEGRLLALARAIPEEKYTWRPVPESRTIAELVAHTNGVLQAFLDGLNEDAASVESVSAIPPQKKATSIELLEVKLAAVKKLVESARNGMLAGDAQLLGESTNRRGLLTALVSALATDTGRLAAYTESMGITLPWQPNPLD